MRFTKLPEPAPFHPLMDRVPRQLTRRAVLLGASGLLATRLAGGISSAQNSAATPDVQIEGEEDAVAILQRSAKVLAQLDTFGFELETVRGSSNLMQGFELKSVSGSVRRPTDLQAEIEVGTPIGSLTIGAISLDGVFYIEDPLSDGAWTEIGRVGEIQTLVNPDIIILAAVRLVQDARVTGSEKIDGVETTSVEGTVDFSGLVEGAGEGQEQISDFLAGEPVDVTFWIDDEDRIIEVELLGPILASESDDVIRVVSLFDFNEPVEIEVPEAVSTPAT